MSRPAPAIHGARSGVESRQLASSGQSSFATDYSSPRPTNSSIKSRRRVVFRVLIVVVVRHLGVDAVQDEAENIHLALVERVQGVLGHARGGEAGTNDHEAAVEIRRKGRRVV